MPKMRAKMQVTSVEEFKAADGEVTSERLKFSAVSKSEAYPADGLDEDNTYAKFSPSADLTITVDNPALFGHFKVGEKYYVDFEQAE